AGIGDMLAQVPHGSDAVVEVILLDDFAKSDGDGIEVAPGEAAIRRESLGEDEQIRLLLGMGVIVRAEKAADVGKAVLLRGERAAVGVREDLAGDVADRLVRVAVLAFSNEERILGKTAGI